MRKLLIPFLGIFLYQCSSTTSETTIIRPDENHLKLNQGSWRFALQLGAADLPFTITLNDLYSDNPVAVIHNQEEEITITDITITEDSIHLSLPVFTSVLSGKIESPSLITGVWNNNSKKNYTIPFIAESDKDFRFTPKKSSTEIQSSYKVLFAPDTESPWDAVLKIQNDDGKLRGTFLTETGDYRYLEGDIISNSIFLSTFDGSHAFYFSAEIQGDSLIKGKFISGTHYRRNWVAIADSTFALRKPESLTFLKDGYSKFDFNLPNQDGDSVSWKDLDLDQKVVIVDIMGSWCPNCIDAKKALIALTEPYSSDQIEILTVAFELTHDIDIASTRLSKMDNDLGISSQEFLFAGYADKNRSAEVFPMLNHIMSFPTLIFIDKDRQIRQIYTGFYGPGTGDYYLNFMENTAQLLKELTEENI